jgi:adenylate cyclase
LTLLVEGFPAAEIHLGESLLVACEASGIPMLSSCGGFAACNSCRVDVLEGADLLEPLRLEEAAFLDRPGQRLGCQATLVGAAGRIRVRLDPGL